MASRSNAESAPFDLFERIAEALAGEGYIVARAALPPLVADCLLQLQDRSSHDFYAASVGRGFLQNQDASLRRDKIAWIDERDAAASAWYEWTRQLQVYLNRRFYLGLFSFESHLALYEPGDFYRTHLDAFRGQSNRRLSLVAYLNPDWQAEQGGELVLYHPQTGMEIERVIPDFGTLVLFLSEEFPHEVLPALRSRRSVAGWFRVNASTGEHLDPPA